MIQAWRIIISFLETNCAKACIVSANFLHPGPAERFQKRRGWDKEINKHVGRIFSLLYRQKSGFEEKILNVFVPGCVGDFFSKK